MKWLKRILLTILVLVLLIIVVSLFLPKTVHIERASVINAQPATVYGIVSNLKSYDKWMPWNQLDPNWKVKYSDTISGKGANYNWVSEKSDVGTGSLTIEDARPNELVTTRLYFEGMGSSLAGWQISPASNSSNVKWYIDMDMSKGGFMSSVMGKWMSATGLMDKMLGEQFEKGLANLKKLAESPEAAQFATSGAAPFRFSIDEQEFGAAIVLTKTGKGNNSAEIGQALGSIYQSIAACATGNGLKIPAAPIAAYQSQSAPFHFWAGMIVDKKPVKECSGIEVNELPAKHVAVCHFYGPYEQTPNGYVALEKWMKANNKMADGSPIEQYVNDPTMVKPEEIQTDILWPVK